MLPHHPSRVLVRSFHRSLSISCLRALLRHLEPFGDRGLLWLLVTASGLLGGLLRDRLILRLVQQALGQGVCGRDRRLFRLAVVVVGLRVDKFGGVAATLREVWTARREVALAQGRFVGRERAALAQHNHPLDLLRCLRDHVRGLRVLRSVDGCPSRLDGRGSLILALFLRSCVLLLVRLVAAAILLRPVDDLHAVGPLSVRPARA